MSAQPVDVLVQEPWQLSRMEWNAERERIRPCYVQEEFTRRSTSEAVRHIQRLEWLLFGVNAEASAKLKAAARGEISMSCEEAEALLEQINRPVTYDDVINRAARLGLTRAQGGAA